jgi:hypothetical protein
MCKPEGLCPPCEARHTEAPTPLEDASLPLHQRLGRTCLQLLLRPRRFLAQAARGDRLDAPLLFMLSIAAVQLAGIVLRSSLEGLPFDAMGTVALALRVPVVFLVRSVVSAALAHPLRLWVTPGSHFRRTWRAVSWGTFFSLLGLVPGVPGMLLGGLLPVLYAALGVRATYPARWTAVGLLVVGFGAPCCFTALYKVFQTMGQSA